MNRKTRVLLFLAGDHPLMGHWGDTASSGAGTFGSQWIHTDTAVCGMGCGAKAHLVMREASLAAPLRLADPVWQ